MLVWTQIYGLTGLGLGLAATALTGHNSQVRAERWGRWGLEPGRFTRPKGILKRAQWLQNHADFIFLLPFLPMMVPILTVGILSIVTGTWTAPLGFFFGFAMPRGVRAAFYENTLGQFKLWLLVVSAKRVAAHCTQDDAKRMLYEWARTPEEDVRVAAINGFMELEPNAGLEALQKMQRDPDVSVRLAANDAFRELNNIASGKFTKPLAPLGRLLEEHRSWLLELRTKRLRKAQLRRNLYLTTRKIDEIIYSQLAQRLAFPHLHCRVCHAWAEQQAYAEWTWVRCRACQEVAELEIGVERVIGQIGGHLPAQQVQGELRLMLWNEAQKSPMAADIDTLEIVGGHAMNYDWAVTSTVERLRAFAPEGDYQVKVALVGAPKLETNTLNVLRVLDASFLRENG